MKKILTGIVKSTKMTGTASVLVTHLKSHPLYGKKTKVTKSFLVDNALKAKEGEVVTIESTRPLSRRKHFRIVKVQKVS